MTHPWNPALRAPSLDPRAAHNPRSLEVATVALEVLAALGGVLVLAAAVFLLISVLNAQVNPNDFDINASGFWRP